MRGVDKSLLAVALAMLLTVGFAACGGDDSDDSTAASTAPATQGTTPTAAPEDNGSAKPEKEPGDDRGGSSGGAGESSSDAGSSPQEGSASFRTPGGDNSIQNYGAEADEEEREAASATVAGFVAARSKGDWEAVCGYMAAAALKPLEQFAARAPQFKGKECPDLLEALTGPAPASTRASTIGDGIDSLRFEGERGFALYHGTDGKDYFLPLVKEDGEWKVGALAPSEFLG